MSSKQALPPCLACAAEDSSCCVDQEVYLTLGDVARISSFSKDIDFFSFELPSPKYAEDKAWIELIVRGDGRRRVLRTRADDACIFLAQSGCQLSLNQRPLLCRIYPVRFNAHDLLDIEPACPLSTMQNAGEWLRKMDMTPENLIMWHRQLYTEIRAVLVTLILLT